MKKITFILVLVSLISLCFINLYKTKEVNDAIKFKEEYEILNNKKTENGENNYLEINIPDDNPIKYKSLKEVKEILKGGTGVIYFGFPECQRCRNVVPALLEASDQMGIEDIYYYNALEIRDTKKLDSSGDIVVKKEGTKDYNELIEIMYDKLPTSEGLNDATIKKLYFPMVVFVKDGSIIDIDVSTVFSKDDPYAKLTSDEYEDLVDIYKKNINKVYDIICDETC